MMTGITIAKETRLFLLSLAVGAGMSFLYDLLRVLRRRTAHRAAAVSLEDILYFLLCALLHFAFVLKDNRGQLRGYILVGELLGWVCWHLSAGAVLVEAGSRLLGIVQRVVAGILRVLLFPLFVSSDEKDFGNFVEDAGKNFKKSYTKGEIYLETQAADVV